ncbi:MAG: site-specific integrase [Deltaproteobacteria bacterium]|nr:site-specific integrase [Deltaproteobacteria bacterium]
MTARTRKANITRNDFGGGWVMPSAVGKIYQDKGQRWLIRLKNGDRIFCDKQHRSFYSQQHAEWTLAQIAGEVENGTFDSSFYSKKQKSLLSFSVYAEQWLKNCERRAARDELSPTYMKDLRRFVNKIFIPYFGETSMLEIKGRELKSFYLGLDYHPKTLYNVMAALHKIFRDALYEEVIPSMPNFPKQGSIPEPEWKWATEDVQDVIMGQLEPDDFYAVMFLCCHGIRTGELRALKHKDLDLKNYTVTIRRSFSGTQLRETTKSKRQRIIPLDETWKEIYLSRPRVIDQDAFIFHKGGKPLSATWLTKQWRKACDKAGVEPITLYQGTRHSLASQAANRGVSLYLIGKQLGHSTTKMTQRYSHVETNALREVSRQTRKNVVSILSVVDKTPL